jgi:hypothetical protein
MYGIEKIALWTQRDQRRYSKVFFFYMGGRYDTFQPIDI